MPKGSRLSFNPEAGTDRAFVRCGFAPRAASVTALLIASTALTAIAFVPSAHAGTPQWLGTASSDWFANGNWSGSPSAVPSAADVSTTIDTTAPNTTVINGAAAATQQLVVGNSGNGNLAITNGGSLGSTNSDLGFFGGSSGTVTVSGSGSSWAVGTSLWVGYNGTGTVQVLQGGVTHADTFSLGVISGSHGAATVDGVGSILSANSKYKCHRRGWRRRQTDRVRWRAGPYLDCGDRKWRRFAGRGGGDWRRIISGREQFLCDRRSRHGLPDGGEWRRGVL